MKSSSTFFGQQEVPARLAIFMLSHWKRLLQGVWKGGSGYERRGFLECLLLSWVLKHMHMVHLLHLLAWDVSFMFHLQSVKKPSENQKSGHAVWLKELENDNTFFSGLIIFILLAKWNEKTCFQKELFGIGLDAGCVIHLRCRNFWTYLGKHCFKGSSSEESN